MSKNVLKASFYDRNPMVVAKELLGKILVRKINWEFLSGIIVETEAYLAAGDTAAHSSRGKTKATQSLYKPAGHLYIHAMHQQSLMDIVTDGEDVPCSVLIRALEPISGIETMKKNRNSESLENLTNWPGKLCKALQIDRNLDGLNICSLDSEVYVLDTQISDEINESIRIWITTNKEPLLRYYIANNKFVSRW